MPAKSSGLIAANSFLASARETLELTASLIAPETEAGSILSVTELLSLLSFDSSTDSICVKILYALISVFIFAEPDCFVPYIEVVRLFSSSLSPPKIFANLPVESPEFAEPVEPVESAGSPESAGFPESFPLLILIPSSTAFSI